jgi:endonuclease III
MKNPSKHSDALRSLQRQLVRQFKPDPIEPIEPLKALVRGAMSFDVSDSKADEAMKAIDREFVDLNELRVATELEVQELLGVRYPQIERRVAMITQALNDIFEREHTLSLDRLKGVSRREARTFLRELPDIHPFVEAFVMLFAFDGHAVPIDDEILSMLRDEDVVEEQTTVEEAQKFVEHHLKTGEAHPFFVAARRFAFEESRKSKKKTRS